LIASAFMMLQAVVMWVTPGNAAIGEVFKAYAAIPDTITLSLAAVVGGAACWFGWHAAPQRKRRRRRSKGGDAAPA
jgi:hypothetical protein